jgi:hypothetical protein
MGFIDRLLGKELTPEQAGLDLDKLQNQLERIAGALERLERKATFSSCNVETCLKLSDRARVRASDKPKKEAAN